MVTATQTSAPSLGRHGNLTTDEQSLFADAERFFPGGALGGNALAADTRFVFEHGDGARFWDDSGNEYIDYVLCSGAMFLGHAHPAIVNAVAQQAARGTHAFAYLNETAVRLARRVVPHMRCAERIRFTTAGSDSTFHAIRLARAFTGREKILKFEGGYHGVHDYAQLSTTPRTKSNFPNGIADTAGIPQAVQDLMLVSPFNDLDTLASILKERGSEIAAIIVEPIQRIISPKPGFLQGIRELTKQYGIVMILDEVVTGFRYGLGGAQEYFDIVPDLATYGKIIGGGLPVGAVAGRADIMDQANPSNKGTPGYVYQNGTLQGHMLGCAAAIATMDVLEQPGVYESVFAMADKLRKGLQEVFDKHRMGILVFGDGPMWHMLFTDKAPTNWRDIVATDTKKMATFEAELLRQGLFILPGNRRFISIRHADKDLEQTFDAADRACHAFLAA
ncbi:MAG: aspartate aminotransferase family protein [Pseudolabrys sp.]